MESQLVQFFKALRGTGVNVSTAEAIEATRTAQLVGYSNRETLKSALGLVLAKSEEDKARYRLCFDAFFRFTEPENLKQTSETDDSDSSLADQIQRAIASVIPGSNKQPQPAPPQSPLGQLLLSEDQTALAMAMASAGNEAGVSNIQWMTQKGIYGRRMMMAMGLEALEQEMWAAEASDDPAQEALGQALRQARDLLRADVKNYVEKEYLLQAAAAGKKLREDTMMAVRIEHLREFREVKELVRKLAKKLIASHTRRKKVYRRGMLDMRTTLRQSVPTGGIPFNVYWKKKKKERPRIMAICDCSGSVSQVSRFLLMFLFSLHEVLPRVRAFAFSSHLGEVTDEFRRMGVDEAIDHTLDQWGMGSTDYGQALEDFTRLALQDIDNRTTVIMLGDARNNYGAPRTDLLQQIYRRSHRLIWLNPEDTNRWGSGDSEMEKYRAYCSYALECHSLRQLERFIDRLLSHQ
ncbi:MAG: VWA domain-containing protein [Ketobacteraceae bacterium]|nr:VWA domain-containing protein [Ketobacteraceae bacterium]